MAQPRRLGMWAGSVRCGTPDGTLPGQVPPAVCLGSVGRFRQSRTGRPRELYAV